jgi:hypothetical protein
VATTGNGWLVPLVDRDSLAAVTARMNELDDERRVGVMWTDTEAVVRELDGVDGGELNRFALPVDASGRVHLRIGLTFVEVR